MAGENASDDGLRLVLLPLFLRNLGMGHLMPACSRRRPLLYPAKSGKIFPSLHQI